jgi:DNA-binding transcriptional regulator PaaX
MGHENQEKIISLTAKEVLLMLIDISLFFERPFFRYGWQRVEIDNYLLSRGVDRQIFSKRIKYLKNQGIIRNRFKRKKGYLELTDKGIEKVDNIKFQDLKIPRPEKWDGKWRLVIFDIPEKDRCLRNFIRDKLYQMGFIQVQKSVFVYPFECTAEINTLCNYSGGRNYIKYMIADIFEGEKEIAARFLDLGLLKRSDLSFKK